MSTDYKNLFKDKKDYSNLFSKTQPTKQEERMAYKNLFENTPPKAPVTSVAPVFPKKGEAKIIIPRGPVDERVKAIQAIDPKVSTHAVLSWVDDFEANFKKVSATNQELSQRELDLAVDFTNGRLSVQDLFNEIKASVARLKGPEKKTNLLSRLLGSQEEFKLSQAVITEVIQSIRSCLDSFKKKAKYNTTMFVRSEMRKIEVDIAEIKSDLSIANIACQYLATTDDFKTESRLQKVQQLTGLVKLSVLQLNKSYELLEKDIERYENLKDVTVPFLYVKIQTLMDSALDAEALNVINDIDKL